LKVGGYRVKYRALVTQGRQVVARTDFSPASNIRVGQGISFAFEPTVVKLNDGLLSIEGNNSANRVEVRQEQNALVLTLGRTRLLLTPGSVRQIVFHGSGRNDTFLNRTDIPSNVIDSDNRAPVAARDRATVEVGKSVEIPVMANDSDPDGDALLVQGFNAASVNGGRVERKGPNRPNVLVYTPRAGFEGKDRFEYTISDGRGGTATAVVEITVERPNRAPVAVRDRATVEVGKSVEIPVMANDSDPDGDAINVLSFSTSSANGGRVERKGPNRPNVLVYTPRPGFVGTDRFQYTISDGRGGTATTVVEITVERPNRAPAAARDRATVEAGKSVEVPVMSNDSDPDGDAISVRTFAASSTNGGRIERKGPNRPNVLVYTPRPGFVGTDRFQYTISDGNGGTSTAVVEIEVRPAPAARDLTTLFAGERLLPGQEIRSADGRYRFVLQHDGNLVLYGPAGKALWSTRTAGKAVTAAAMQSDGNFVLYNHSKAVWHTRTHGHSGARLVVLDTGDVVIRGSGGKILWQARQG